MAVGFLSNVRTFSLPSLWWLGLGATACVEGMLPACSCVCDRSDKRRKDKKKNEFNKEKTNRRAISTVTAVLFVDKLSFLSLEVRSCEIVHVTADAAKQLFSATDHVPTGSVTQRSNNERLFNIGLAPPASSTERLGDDHEQRDSASLKSPCRKCPTTPRDHKHLLFFKEFW